jgi:hypothetical protein
LLGEQREDRRHYRKTFHGFSLQSFGIGRWFVSSIFFCCCPLRTCMMRSNVASCARVINGTSTSQLSIDRTLSGAEPGVVPRKMYVNGAHDLKDGGNGEHGASTG